MCKKFGIAKERESVFRVRNKKGRKKAARAEDRQERRKHGGVGAEKRYKARDIVKAADETLEVIERHVRVGGAGKDGKEERQDLGAGAFSETGPEVFKVLQRLRLVLYPEMQQFFRRGRYIIVK